MSAESRSPERYGRPCRRSGTRSGLAVVQGEAVIDAKREEVGITADDDLRSATDSKFQHKVVLRVTYHLKLNGDRRQRSHDCEQVDELCALGWTGVLVKLRVVEYAIQFAEQRKRDQQFAMVESEVKRASGHRGRKEECADEHIGVKDIARLRP
jgi:hypothetical protein